MSGEYCVGMITTSSREEAQRIAEALVHERLAACVTIVPEVESVYWWEGRIVRDREVLLLVKTMRAKWPRLMAVVKERHSYQVPEIIALPIVEGSEAYLEWLAQSLNAS
ncbi:MAG: divalent-cation tolerance protein CutA [Blastocatellia bacterium]|nr:divalent-cation tolerance protein CutA [Blastocatellia bacterium]MCS7156451.1 divalent-cation tolerance protein CutA [Blastocatellia bacterium]MCX7751808.1 divalent-cation tolerance protein CutA [Blastocatellia bacterium]MDW8168910.1 divalent-cation tolerance protein CutA [Acidobacteriota bacterium]MDW8256670.1 divalent-cation tolerance protein CutA [Acidobacteriota bacterium]